MDELEANKILKQVLAENKAYSKLYDPSKVKVVYASPGRKGSGGIEYWPSDEPGTKELPHPIGGGVTALEIYSNELKNNPELLKKAIYGDLIHGMKNDSEFNQMRNDFKNNYTPEELSRIKNKQSWWDDANGNNANDMAVHDAYIRGMLNEPDVATEGQKNTGNTMYSPAQLEILRKMQNYIKNGNVPISATTQNKQINW